MSDIKRISLSVPDFIYDALHSKIRGSGATRSYHVRHLLIDAMINQGMLSPNIKEELYHWEENVKNKRATNTGGGRTIDYTTSGKRLKKLLDDHPDHPVTLRFIADTLGWNRTTAKKVIEHFEDDFIIVCGAKYNLGRGESWRIAPVDTPAAKEVKRLMKDRGLKEEEKPKEKPKKEKRKRVKKQQPVKEPEILVEATPLSDEDLDTLSGLIYDYLDAHSGGDIIKWKYISSNLPPLYADVDKQIIKKVVRDIKQTLEGENYTLKMSKLGVTKAWK